MKFEEMKFIVYTNNTRRGRTYPYLKNIGADTILFNGSEKRIDADDKNEMLLSDKSVLDAHRNILDYCKMKDLEYVWIAEDGLRKLFIQDPETFLWKKMADLSDEELQGAVEKSFNEFVKRGLDYMPLVLRMAVKRDRLGTIEQKENQIKKLGTTFTLWRVSALRDIVNKLDELSGGAEISHGLDLMFAGTAAVLGLQNAVDYSVGVDEIPDSTLRTEENDALNRVKDIKNFVSYFPKVKLFFSWSKAQPHTVSLTEEDQSDYNVGELKRNIALIKNEDYRKKMEKAFEEVFGDEQ